MAKGLSEDFRQIANKRLIFGGFCGFWFLMTDPISSRYFPSVDLYSTTRILVLREVNDDTNATQVHNKYIVNWTPGSLG